ncbi:MAG: MFS transporter [Pseudomonadota bacterium]
MSKTSRILKILRGLKIDKKHSFFCGLNHIFLLLISILFLSTAMGINIVSLPLVLYQNQVPISLIGFATASDILGGISIIYLLHKLGKKLGIFNSILFFGCLASGTILLLPFYQNFILWLLLSFALGTAIISIISLRSAWINITIKNKIRAMIIATSSTAVCIGFTIGPIIVKFIGAGDYKVFIISSLFTLLSCLILFPIRQFEPKLIPHSKLRLIVFIKRNPRIFLARFLTDLQCGTIIFFTVIYGIKSNISAENSGLLISIFSSIGILDFLIGFMINQKSYQKLILWGFVAFFLAIAALPWAIKNYYSASLIYLILGWITSLVSICCWYGANLKRRKNQMIFINSSFAAIGLFGGFCGNLLAGIAMQFIGKEGFVLIIAASSLVYLGISAKRGGARAP